MDKQTIEKTIAAAQDLNDRFARFTAFERRVVLFSDLPIEAVDELRRPQVEQARQDFNSLPDEGKIGFTFGRMEAALR
jgi:hypothetical protein